MSFVKIEKIFFIQILSKFCLDIIWVKRFRNWVICWSIKCAVVRPVASLIPDHAYKKETIETIKTQ